MGFENLWEDLDLTAKANNAAFGIEYCLRGQADSARELLKEGKELCQILLKASRVHRKDEISVQEIPLWRVYDLLVQKGESSEDLNIAKLPTKLRQCQRVIQSFLASSEMPSREKLLVCQDLFSNLGDVFLISAAHQADEYVAVRGVVGI